MNTVQLLRDSLKNAHEWFEGTMADVTPEIAHQLPPGVAHNVASRYAHLIVSEDSMVSGMLKHGAPLLATTFAGKTGISDPKDAMSSPLDWAKTVKVDLPTAKQYAQAVYAASDAYIGSLKEADLDTEVDLKEWGMGKWKLDLFLEAFIVGHVRDIMGEISAIKGVHGAKGYPF